MQYKSKSRIFFNIIIPALTGIFSFLAKSTYFNKLLLQYITDNTKVIYIQEFLLGLSVIITSIIISYTLFKKDKDNATSKNESEKLLSMVKDIFNRTLSSALGLNIDFNVRIFVPHKSLKYKLLHKLKGEYPLAFVIKNYSYLAKRDKTDNLKFIVSPPSSAQGLVGKTYSSGKIVFDDDLESTNHTTYNLTEYQISKTNDLRFSITCPVYDPNNHIVAIVAFDTSTSIKIDTSNEKTICDAINNFSRLLFDSIPCYFKPEGGLL